MGSRVNTHNYRTLGRASRLSPVALANQLALKPNLTTPVVSRSSLKGHRALRASDAKAAQVKRLYARSFFDLRQKISDGGDTSISVLSLQV
jgi:hypothetical protein